MGAEDGATKYRHVPRYRRRRRLAAGSCGNG